MLRKLTELAIRSVALSSGIGVYFDKIYVADADADADGKFDAPTPSMYEQLGVIDFEGWCIEGAGEVISKLPASADKNFEDDYYDEEEEVTSAYVSLISKALLDCDLGRAINVLLDYWGWRGCCDVIWDVFSCEDIDKYQHAIFERVLLEPNCIDSIFSDDLIDDFLRLAVDEDDVRGLISWVVLMLVPDCQARRIARHYIAHGETSRVKLLAANYLYDLGFEVQEEYDEVLRVYLSELKISASIISERNSYFNHVIYQAYVRMCFILIRSSVHEYDDFLSEFLDFLESSHSPVDSVAKYYMGLRYVIQNYFGGVGVREAKPLSSYYKSLVFF